SMRTATGFEVLRLTVVPGARLTDGVPAMKTLPLTGTEFVTVTGTVLPTVTGTVLVTLTLPLTGKAEGAVTGMDVLVTLTLPVTGIDGLTTVTGMEIVPVFSLVGGESLVWAVALVDAIRQMMTTEK